ncbi:hypothetical protein HKX48_008039 [Thoreauomyces humboldtii]|nr:hypothetical protein HKX48_008039 [Thoreauomyces humboldtii]
MLSASSSPTAASSPAQGTSSVCPLPAAGTYLDSVRSSCHRLVCQSTGNVKIDDAALDAFISNIPTTTWKEVASKPPQALRMPLRFDTLEQEMTLVALTAYLSFGYAWRADLMKELDRDEIDTVRFGIMSMHISSVSLTSAYLSTLSLPDASSLFSIPISKDVQHPTLPLTVSEHHPLRPYVAQLVTDTNALGVRLLDMRCGSLGHFVVDRSKDGNVDALLEAVVNVFGDGASGDRGRCDGVDAYAFRRAQNVVRQVQARLACVKGHSFGISDAEVGTGTTALADPDLVEVLVDRGVIVVDVVGGGGERGATDGDDGQMAVLRLRLRAAAVEAVEKSVQKLKGKEGLDGVDARVVEEVVRAAQSKEARSVKGNVDVAKIFGDKQCTFY